MHLKLGFLVYIAFSKHILMSSLRTNNDNMNTLATLLTSLEHKACGDERSMQYEKGQDWMTMARLLITCQYAFAPPRVQGGRRSVATDSAMILYFFCLFISLSCFDAERCCPHRHISTSILVPPRRSSPH